MTCDELVNYREPKSVYDLMSYNDYCRYAKEFFRRGYIQVKLIGCSICVTTMEANLLYDRIQKAEEDEFYKDAVERYEKHTLQDNLL